MYQKFSYLLLILYKGLIVLVEETKLIILID